MWLLYNVSTSISLLVQYYYMEIDNDINPNLWIIVYVLDIYDIDICHIYV